MPSLIQGYEYDIFISYRQNDNRSGWVTEFVKSLQEELAATIKNPVSIYFDRNPHDGLLETHDVDKSLEGKLKSLIFIPIVSQTYCDPKSFAWQHEFRVFNQMAKEDPFGRDVRLGQGNVSSRILPIRIHDLDSDDKAVIESELGGVLRAIDFIFSSPGVNRPLTSSDKREDNSNRTLYRDQVNKVANSVKEIMAALTKPVPSIASAQKTALPEATGTKKSSFSIKYKVVTALLILLVLVVLMILMKRRDHNRGEPSSLDKSIAVLPFVDMSPNHDQEYFGDGVAEEIINVLAQTPDLKVIARSSSFQFKGKNEDLKKVGDILGVSTILEGSIRKSDNQIRVTAQLIKTSDGSHLWSKTFDRSPTDVFAVQDEIALAVATALKSRITDGATSGHRTHWDEEAKKEYQLGRYYFDRHAEGDYDLAMMHFRKSIEIDSSKAIVYPLLFITCISQAGYGSKGEFECTKNLDKALQLDPHQPEALIYNSFRYLNHFDFHRAEEEMNKALKYGRNHPIVLRSAVVVLSAFGRSEEAIRLGEEAVALDPLLTFSYLNLSYAYASVSRFEDAINSLKRAREISMDRNDNLVILYVLNNQKQEATQENEHLNGPAHDFNEIFIEQKFGDKAKASTLLQQFIKVHGKNSPWKCAQAAAFLGDKDLAFEWLEKCYQERNPPSVRIKVDPLLSSLRGENRFKALIKKMDFPSGD